MKKIDLVYSKIREKCITTALEDPFCFNGCKTNEDVLCTLGCQGWEDVLFEVGYSPRYYIGEVQNMSKRFLKLFDKVVAMCDDDLIKTITAMVDEYKEKNNLK